MSKHAQPDEAKVQPAPECFVIMPISTPSGYPQDHFRRVYEDLFRTACEQAGYKAVLASDVSEANLIQLDILKRLLNAPMVLCDLSSRNPNVLFELGLRQAFDKKVVLVQEVGTERIFDITPLRVVDYRKALQYREVLEDQKAIASALMSTRDADHDSVNSIVRLLSLQSAVLPRVDHNPQVAQMALLSEQIKQLQFLVTEKSHVESITRRDNLRRRAEADPFEMERTALAMRFQEALRTGDKAAVEEAERELRALEQLYDVNGLRPPRMR